MKKAVIILLCLFNGLIAAQTPVNGVVQIKVNPSIEPAVVQQYRASQQTASPVRFRVGIQRFDAVNQRFNATGLRRVFPDAGEYEALHRKAGLHLWYELDIDATTNVKEAVKAYTDLPEIEEAGVVYPIRRIQHVEPEMNDDQTSPKPLATTTNDPYYPRQWHYTNTGTNGRDGVAGMDINVANAWDKTRGDNTVIVAVVDDGIDYNHPDLAANMWPGIGYNFVRNSSIVTAEDHGTHVAGTIAAITNNGIGVSGIAGGTGAGDGVRLMSCQIFEGDNGGSSANAIVYGADKGAVICQNSWGYENPGVYNKPDSAAIVYFIENAGKDPAGNPRPGTKMVGGLVIFAAGNSHTNDKWYPGYFDFVTTVASISSKGQRAYYSNYGPWVDITAPGGDYFNTGYQGGSAVDISRTVLSTLPHNSAFEDTLVRGYGYMQGTSMACPHVSGIAALVLSRLGSETYTPAMLRERLINAVRPLVNDSYYNSGGMGAGLIDAAMAVADYVPVTGISINPNPSVYLNHSTTCTATILPTNATNKRVNWSTADETIATIDNNGKVYGRALGTVIITATSQADTNYKTTAVLTVTPVPVDSISINPGSAVMKPGEDLKLQIIFTPFDATNKTINWRSENESVATVDNTGLVIALDMGTVDIIAESNSDGKVAICHISVVQPVTGVTLYPEYARLVAGDTLTFRVEVIPSDAENKAITWSSSNSGVVSVDAAGKLQAKKAGSARVTVRTNDGGYTAVCAVEVFDVVQAPQGFSPNGDGINDYFELVLDSHETYSLVVFDRSGQFYYRSAGYDNHWDGMANTGKYAGSKVPAGTYFYQLTGSSSGNKSGYVVIKY